MKRLILAGLCCVMLAGCTNANSDSISEGEVHLGEVLDQTGHSFSYMASGSELTAGLYTDGEGWFLTSVRTVKGQQDPVITDQPMRQIVAELIREKALRLLSEEIPHGIAVSIEQMKPRPNGKIWDIEATIVCERDSHKGIIIGKGGAMLKKIGSAARYEIERQLDAKVNLRLWVKVKKDWRDSDFLMKNFGYDKKEV